MIIKKIKELNKDKKFWIDPDVFDKIIAFAESAYRQFKTEIGGQLIIREDKDGDFILEDPVILKQTVAGANCELDEEALAVHYSKMAGKHGDNIRHCWWHSHHTMGAFWSGTDTSTIESNESKDFTVSLVVNLKKEYKLRVQFFYPFEHHEDVDLNFLSHESIVDKELDSQVKELCSKETYTYQNLYKNGNKVQQTNLWNQTSNGKPDEYNTEDIKSWNESFGVYGYQMDSGSYSCNGRSCEADMSKIPANKEEYVLKRIETIQDGIAEGNINFNMFVELRQKLNKDIAQYNIRIKSITKEELDNITYHSWPEDLIENIIPTINVPSKTQQIQEVNLPK